MRVVLFLSFVCFAGFHTGCSSSEPVERSAANNVQTFNRPGNSNAAPDTGPADPNSANVPSQTERVMTKVEKLRAEAANSATKAPKPVPRKGPEDSLIYTELTDKARETRVWSKHPQLLKVLKEHDPQGGTLKIYLRDGRTFERPGKEIPYLDQITATAVLQLVGVTPNAESPPRQGGKVDKKGEN